MFKVSSNLKREHEHDCDCCPPTPRQLEAEDIRRAQRLPGKAEKHHLESDELRRKLRGAEVDADLIRHYQR